MVLGMAAGRSPQDPGDLPTSHPRPVDGRKSTCRAGRQAGSVRAVEPPEPAAKPRVDVRRSMRRRRTVSAYRDGATIVVLIPGRMSRAEERRWVAAMVERVTAQEQRRRPSDNELMRRAKDLSARHLDGRVTPTSVRWADNQLERWGSCTPADGTIRISTRLRGLPSWVLDYVILHELAHLVVPGHDARFWRLLESYPRTERARGFLEGIAAAQHQPAEID